MYYLAARLFFPAACRLGLRRISLYFVIPYVLALAFVILFAVSFVIPQVLAIHWLHARARALLYLLANAPAPAITLCCCF